MSSPQTNSWGGQLASLDGLVTKLTRQGRRCLASLGLVTRLMYGVDPLSGSGLVIQITSHECRCFTSLGGLLLTRPVHGRIRLVPLDGLVTRLTHGRRYWRVRVPTVCHSSLSIRLPSKLRYPIKLHDRRPTPLSQFALSFTPTA